MKSTIIAVVMSVIATAAIMFAAQSIIFPTTKDFRITELSLTDLDGNAASVQEGRAGYVVFYSDLESCTSCVRKLGHMSNLSETYPDVGFYAIMRSASYKDPFVAQMREHQVPGDYLIDDNQNLAAQMGLSDHSHLLFFDRYENLIAIMALTVDQDGLLKQYHRYIAEM